MSWYNNYEKAVKRTTMENVKRHAFFEIKNGLVIFYVKKKSHFQPQKYMSYDILCLPRKSPYDSFMLTAEVAVSSQTVARWPNKNAKGFQNILPYCDCKRCSQNTEKYL